MSFDKLDKKELVRTAEEDFAVELSEDEKKSAKNIIAALTESGVTFAQYLECNPHQREKFAPVEEAPKPAAAVVTAPAATASEDDTVVEHDGIEIVTKEATPNLTTQQQWLVKMERKNPLFEIAGRTGKVHKFTQEHPYALMSAEDAEVVLHEDGFRQAFPSEIQEYYS